MGEFQGRLTHFAGGLAMPSPRQSGPGPLCHGLDVRTIIAGHPNPVRPHYRTDSCPAWNGSPWIVSDPSRSTLVSTR
jgi:hypothetical protein